MEGEDQTGPRTPPRGVRQDQNGRKRLKDRRMKTKEEADGRCSHPSNMGDEEHRKLRGSWSMRRLRILRLQRMEWQDGSLLIG